MVHSQPSVASELPGGPSLPSFVPSTLSPVVSVSNEKLPNDGNQQQLSTASLGAYTDARVPYNSHRSSADSLPMQALPDQSSLMQPSQVSEPLNNWHPVEQSLRLLQTNSDLYLTVPAGHVQSPILEKPAQQSALQYGEHPKIYQSKDESVMPHHHSALPASVGYTDSRLQSLSAMAPPGGALKNRNANNSALKPSDSTTSGIKKCVTFNDNMVTEYSFSGSYGSTSSEGSCLPQSPAELTETFDVIHGGIAGIPSGHNQNTAYVGPTGLPLLYGVQSKSQNRATGQPHSAVGNLGGLPSSAAVPHVSTRSTDIKTEYVVSKADHTSVR